MSTSIAAKSNNTALKCLITYLEKISTTKIIIISLCLRILFFSFGLYQDENMPLPYTDIDYYVFTDASKFVINNQSPFLRATYRYTPLLSWILIPTTYTSNKLWFSFGKFIFIICDLITGYISMISLPSNLKYLSLIWLFNPMVITISTRGSSESLLTCFVLLSIHFLTKSEKLINIIISGLLLGISIHLKIYPFVYISTFLLYLDSNQPLYLPITFKRFIFISSIILSFSILTYWMYTIYGWEYLNEAYLYHLIRLDHRHNFSIYNISLYLNSFNESKSLNFEKLAFVPQLGLSVLIIPLSLRKGLQSSKLDFKNSILYKILFIQTFIFIMFNKVCTSQYFIWFLCLLPQYIVWTTIGPKKGLILLLGWLITQGLWLYSGWKLEFIGQADIFTTHLFASSCAFFLWNTCMVCIYIEDVGDQIVENEKNSIDNHKKTV